MSNVITTYSEEDFKTVLRDCIKSELSKSAPPQTNPEIEEDLITENEARDCLQVSKVTLKVWRDKGLIPFYRFGTRIRYKRSELLNKKNGRTGK